MNDREKENREYEEFLKLFYGQHDTKQKTSEYTSETGSPQQTGQEDTKRQNTDRAFFQESGTDNTNRQINRTQSSREPGVYYRKSPRKLSRRKRRQRQIRILSVAVLVALILTIILIARSFTSDTDMLKGTWNLDGITVYKFDGKGAGSLNLPSNSYAFTYKIKDGTLAIDFENETARDMTYTFKADKNKLTLADSEGKESKTFELTKQKD